MIWNDQKASKALPLIFDSASGRADPALIVPRHLPSPAKGRCGVIGAEKAFALKARDGRWAIAGDCDVIDDVDMLRELANET
ncbi:hypothetical protein HFO94_29700 [Rhizobium leguminosarum]|uniref:hypothetical protein n=1 Tax=Rhizobium leguminosarum TaxID=384 RepID=UPI001C94FFE2|nr:hypothetical protein [Rhizobium leguminosarum]MBY5357641.1 hypothetical protein [Rhizobium leguminosarum]